MLHINPNQCLKQMPLRLGIADPAVEVEMPYGWLTRLEQITLGLFNLPDAEKEIFITNMEKFAGPNSSYTLKAQLHESLIAIYVRLASEKTTADQKAVLVMKLYEGMKNCTPGFYNRINEAIASLSRPENLDDLLSALRHSIVSNAASRATDEVHAKNRFFVVARNSAYGVRPFNADDVYRGRVSDETIIVKLKEAFEKHYTVFSILNELVEQLQAIARDNNYRGRCEEGYKGDYQNFLDGRLLESLGVPRFSPFVEVDNEDGITSKIVDIDWGYIKKAILKKMREEKYFIFTPQEETLLQWMESGALPLELTPEALSLFTTPNELVQALVFFKEMPITEKVELIYQFINQVSLDVLDALLDKLEKNAELSKELGSDRDIQVLLLSKAVHDNKLDKVKALVASGADINPHLRALVQKHKNPVLQWLMNDAAVRATITRDSLQAIAETLINSKKGRQILLADERLRGMCPDMLAGKSMHEWMQQAEAEKIVRMRDGFFASAHPLVQQFLQHIIYGEQAQAEKILKDHPQMALELLTTKLKVKDYSGRKIYGAALQLAAGAEDVRYHENEICMVEMLTPYIKSLPDGEKIMAAQIAEQFPEGYEEQEQQRITDDETALIKVLDAIGRSNNDAECELALQEFDNYLKPKGVIRTGKHFNEKLQEKADKLYDKRYVEFGGWDSRKNNLAWRRVNGRIQRNYTACLAQAASQGLYYIVDEGEKLQRTLELRNDPGVRFYPLDLNPASRLGRDYAIGRGRAARVARAGEYAGPSFSKLCRAKNKNIGTTYTAARESCKQMRGNVAMF